MAFAISYSLVGIDQGEFKSLVRRRVLAGYYSAANLVETVSAAARSMWIRQAQRSSEVKFRDLGVPRGPVISEACALAMARGVRERFGTDVGIATTGVAGPTEQEGQPGVQPPLLLLVADELGD